MGAWIEIPPSGLRIVQREVAPLVGAWIEIKCRLYSGARKRVAPLVGAWIEIRVVEIFLPEHLHVAPLVGAWIEITNLISHIRVTSSLPLWERGLKSIGSAVGVFERGRSPCGSVD